MGASTAAAGGDYSNSQPGIDSMSLGLSEDRGGGSGRQQENSRILRPPGRHARQYEQGRAIFIELIDFLQQKEPVPQIEWQSILQLICCKRVGEVSGTNSAQTNLLDHAKDVAVLFGSIFDKIFIDFTSAYEVALSFVLCDGDPYRHNRGVLFNKQFHKGAVASHYDETIGLIHSITLVDGLVDLNDQRFDSIFKKKMKQIAVDCVKQINRIRTNPHYALNQCQSLLQFITHDHLYRRPGGMIIPMIQGAGALEDLKKDLNDLIIVSERENPRKLYQSNNQYNHSKSSNGYGNNSNGFDKPKDFQSILGKLKYSSWLSRACYEHCYQMAKYNYLDHERKRPAYGKDFGSQQERYVYIKGDAAESLHGGHGYGKQIAWSLLIDDGVKSRGHRCQMLAKEFKFIGIGIGLHPSRGLATTINYFEDFEPVIRVHHK